MTAQPTLFDLDSLTTTASQAVNPAGYKGFSAFHKYWGKKPIEPLLLMIERLSAKDDIVLDPFLGGGLLPRATISRGRRFIGIDINPCAIELARLFVELPTHEEYASALSNLTASVAPEIEKSYARSDGSIGSHYLWENDVLTKVWEKNGRNRVEHKPDAQDIQGTRNFELYTPKHIRTLTTFQNSRINSKENMGINALFTGRALRNIDLLLDNILSLPTHLRRALLLTLTSASGQMSNMVFAISKRGKANGTDSAEHIEVGSWAIGFWCPNQHFEINSWNCFENRAKRFLKTLKEQPPPPRVKIASRIDEFYANNAVSALCLTDAGKALNKIASESISLVITDPPHSDRVPYLELSDFWNAILQYPQSCFSEEIVISNAKGRSKDLNTYIKAMRAIMQECSRVLTANGVLCVQFNATGEDSWQFLQAPPGLRYCGCFPLEYSARSLVQDNRKGAMKHDYALLYKRSDNSQPLMSLNDILGWSTSFPKGEI